MMTYIFSYIFHTDLGHGWLAVKISELEQIGIIDKISSCSYQRGKTVYLEEDCYYNKLLIAKEAISEEFTCRNSFQKILQFDHISHLVLDKWNASCYAVL